MQRAGPDDAVADVLGHEQAPGDPRRAEHWVVVKGTARVSCGENVFNLHENESTYIPIGEKHRLENPGNIPLEIIEIQSGSYLGEDDIVRFEDVYDRCQAKS